tara:strand:- start:288 stop:491 length:204 start_codon:yes stop_codon:yes gene_type:complete
LKLRPGDLLQEGDGVVIRELTFKEWVNEIDNQMIEYDLETAWRHWQKEGPRLELLMHDGTLSYEWSK